MASLELYTLAGEVLRDFLLSKGSLKNLCYAARIPPAFRAPIISLVNNTLRFRPLLLSILTTAHIPGFRLADVVKYEANARFNALLAPAANNSSSASAGTGASVDDDDENGGVELPTGAAALEGSSQASWQPATVAVTLNVTNNNNAGANANAGHKGQQHNNKSTSSTVKIRFEREAMLILAYDMLFGQGLPRFAAANSAAPGTGAAHGHPKGSHGSHNNNAAGGGGGGDRSDPYGFKAAARLLSTQPCPLPPPPAGSHAFAVTPSTYTKPASKAKESQVSKDDKDSSASADAADAAANDSIVAGSSSNSCHSNATAITAYGLHLTQAAAAGALSVLVDWGENKAREAAAAAANPAANTNANNNNKFNNKSYNNKFGNNAKHTSNASSSTGGGGGGFGSASVSEVKTAIVRAAQAVCRVLALPLPPALAALDPQAAAAGPSPHPYAHVNNNSGGGGAGGGANGGGGGNKGFNKGSGGNNNNNSSGNNGGNVGKVWFLGPFPPVASASSPAHSLKLPLTTIVPSAPSTSSKANVSASASSSSPASAGAALVSPPPLLVGSLQYTVAAAGPAVTGDDVNNNLNTKQHFNNNNNKFAGASGKDSKDNLAPRDWPLSKRLHFLLASVARRHPNYPNSAAHDTSKGGGQSGGQSGAMTVRTESVITDAALDPAHAVTVGHAAALLLAAGSAATASGVGANVRGLPAGLGAVDPYAHMLPPALVLATSQSGPWSTVSSRRPRYLRVNTLVDVATVAKAAIELANTVPSVKTKGKHSADAAAADAAVAAAAKEAADATKKHGKKGKNMADSDDDSDDATDSEGDDDDDDDGENENNESDAESASKPNSSEANAGAFGCGVADALAPLLGPRAAALLAAALRARSLPAVTLLLTALVAAARDAAARKIRAALLQQGPAKAASAANDANVAGVDNVFAEMGAECMDRLLRLPSNSDIAGSSVVSASDAALLLLPATHTHLPLARVLLAVAGYTEADTYTVQSAVTNNNAVSATASVASVGADAAGASASASANASAGAVVPVPSVWASGGDGPWRNPPATHTAANARSEKPTIASASASGNHGSNSAVVAPAANVYWLDPGPLFPFLLTFPPSAAAKPPSLTLSQSSGRGGNVLPVALLGTALITSGALIPQDKASCFTPAALLGPELHGMWGQVLPQVAAASDPSQASSTEAQIDDDVDDLIDACAAPGNKTSFATALTDQKVKQHAWLRYLAARALPSNGENSKSSATDGASASSSAVTSDAEKLSRLESLLRSINTNGSASEKSASETKTVFAIERNHSRAQMLRRRMAHSHALPANAGKHGSSDSAAPANDGDSKLWRSIYVVTDATKLQRAATTAAAAAVDASSSSSSHAVDAEVSAAIAAAAAFGGVFNAKTAAVTVLHTSFFLLDPQSAQFAAVGSVMLDPSCSGSGNPSLDALFATGGLQGDYEDGGCGFHYDTRNSTGTSPSANSHTAVPYNALLANAVAIALDPSSKRPRSKQPPYRTPAVPAPADALNSPAPHPCTHLGTSLHVRSLSDLQTALLAHAARFPAVRAIGYSTCSIFTRENEGVVMRFMPHAAAAGFALAPALPRQAWRRRGITVAPAEQLQGVVTAATAAATASVLSQAAAAAASGGKCDAVLGQLLPQAPLALAARLLHYDGKSTGPITSSTDCDIDDDDECQRAIAAAEAAGAAEQAALVAKGTALFWRLSGVTITNASLTPAVTATAADSSSSSSSGFRSGSGCDASSAVGVLPVVSFPGGLLCSRGDPDHDSMGGFFVAVFRRLSAPLGAPHTAAQKKKRASSAVMLRKYLDLSKYQGPGIKSEALAAKLASGVLGRQVAVSSSDSDIGAVDASVAADDGEEQKESSVDVAKSNKKRTLESNTVAKSNATAISGDKSNSIAPTIKKARR